VRKVFSSVMSELIDADEAVHMISCDAGQGVFDRIISTNPNKYMNLGVAEQAALGVASGMALEGLKPYVYAITPFLLERAFEQIKLDVVEQKANVKIIGYWAYPGTGPTHLTKNPEGICRILGIPFYEPANSDEMKKMLYDTYSQKGPAFFSLGEDKAVKDQIKKLDVAVAIILNEANQVLLQKKDSSYSWFPGKWCLPGGEIEGDESPEDCIRRELCEEIGENLQDISLLGTNDFMDRSVNMNLRMGTQWVFIARSNKKIKDLVINEGAGIAYFSKEEIDQIPLVGHDFRVIKKYIRHLD